MRRKMSIPKRIFRILLIGIGFAFILFLLVLIYANLTFHATPITNHDMLEDVSYFDSRELLYDGDTYLQKEDVLTFLLMGIDDWERVDEAPDGISGGQADALFLVVMDQKERSLSIVTINRNAMVLLDLYDESGAYQGQGYGQITLQHAYGDGMQLSCERTANAVSRLFYQIPIDGYASLNMGATSIMVNIAGGFTLVSLEDIDVDDFHVKRGDEIALDGKNAYYYLKYRNTDMFDSVSLRQARLEQFLTLYTDRVMEIAQKDPTFFITLYQVLENYLVTDLTPGELVYLVTEAAFYDSQSVSFLSVPGEEVMGEEFEEFYVDTDAFFPLYLQLFYQKQEGNH